MAFSHIITSTYSTSGATSLSISQPAGSQIGDLIIATYSWGTNIDFISIPSGLPGSPFTGDGSNIEARYRQLDGTETWSSSITAHNGGSDAICACLSVFRGSKKLFNTSSESDDRATSYSDKTTSPVNFFAVNVQADGDLVYCSVAARYTSGGSGSSVTMPPSGYTTAANFADSGGKVVIATAYKFPVAVSFEDPADPVISTTNLNRWNSIVVSMYRDRPRQGVL